VFSKSSLSNLEITLNSYDEYELGSDGYYIVNTSVMSKRNYYYATAYAKKVVDYVEQDGKYTLLVSYLLGDSDGHDSYYGNIDDLKNSVNAIADVGDSVNDNTVQNYLDNNYEQIKSKLSTYNYVFDGNCKLVNFYIN